MSKFLGVELVEMLEEGLRIVLLVVVVGYCKLVPYIAMKFEALVK